MKFLTFTVFLVYAFTVFGQNIEQITNIKSPGDLNIYHFTEVDNKSYVIALDIDDFVSVYTKQGNELNFQHSKKLNLIDRDDFFRNFRTRHFVYRLEDSLVIYNFTTNSLNKYDLGSSINQFWDIYHYENELILTEFIGNDSKTFILNLETFDTINLAPGHYQAFNNRYFQKRVLDGIEFESRNGEPSHLIETPLLYIYQDHFINDKYIFKSDTTVQTYNLTTRQQDTIFHDINLKYVTITYNEKEKRYYCELTVVDEMGWIAGSRILILNENFDVIIEIPIQKRLDFIIPQTVNNHFAYHTDSLYFINIFSPDEVFAYDSWFVNETEIIGMGNQLFYILESDEIKIFDTTTKEIENIFRLPVYSSDNDRIEVMEFDSFYLVNNIGNRDDFQPFIEVKKTKEADLSDKIGSTDLGINVYNDFISFENGMAVIGNDLYHVKGSLYEKISNSSIQYKKHRVTNDKLFWIETDSLFRQLLYTEKDGKSVLLTKSEDLQGTNTFTSDITDYAVVGDFMYYKLLGFEDEFLRRVDLKNGATIIVGEIGDRPNIEYYVFKDRFYFLDIQDNLYFVNEAGITIHLKDNNLPIKSFPFVAKEELFGVNGHNIYKIEKDGSLEPIVPLIDNNLNKLILSDDYILFNDKNLGYLLFDGKNLIETPIPSDFKLYKWNVLGAGILYISHQTPSNNTNKYFYDPRLNKLSLVPVDIDGYSYEKIFEQGLDTFLIASKNSNYILEKYIFHLNGIDNVVEEIYNSKNIRWNFKSYVQTYKNESFINLGEELLILDSLNNVIPILGIKGVERLIEVHEYNGYFYFIAAEAKNGRQVYRVRSFVDQGIPSSLQEVIKYSSQLSIYPNPANSGIKINNELNLRFDNLEIIDLFGRILLTTTETESQIDVRSLPPGNYIVKAYSGTKTFVGKFIRVD